MAKATSVFMLISVGKTAATVYTIDYRGKINYKIVIEITINNERL